MIRVLVTLFATLLGLAFGSFLNVCLSRWPEGESIVHPRSHCRTCGRTIASWENIPLLSWIALRGRCRTCGTWIGWRYVLVEAAVGALWGLAAWRSLPPVFNPAVPDVFYWIQLAVAGFEMLLIWILVALAVLDAEHLWLPDFLTLPAIGLGLLLGLSRLPILMKLSAATGIPLTEGVEKSRYGIFTPALELIAGVVAAAMLILAIRWIYWLIRQREGLGLGDAKLMALLAAWLGFSGALLAFGIGVVIGALLALMILLVPRHPLRKERWGALKLPLGTFLCIGGVISTLWGQQIIAAYLRWVGF
jgi:leader peptidase (prepilin peptidase) / N-methyltransferase